MSQGDLFAPVRAETRLAVAPVGSQYVLRRLHPWQFGDALETAFAQTALDVWVIARDWRAEKSVFVLEVVTPSGERLDMGEVLGPFRRPEFQGAAR